MISKNDENRIKRTFEKHLDNAVQEVAEMDLDLGWWPEDVAMHLTKIVFAVLLYQREVSKVADEG